MTKTFIIIAVVLFAVSLYCLTRDPYFQAGPNPHTPQSVFAIAPNEVAARVGCGFAIAGGLALVASAISVGKKDDPKV